MSQIKPLGNTVLFVFLDQTGGAQGAFSERTRSGLIIPTTKSTQKDHRWGKVIAVGPKVDGVSPGDYVLIEALMWMEGVKVDDQKLWKTDDSKILMVTDDESLTVTW